jgi:hypothetical protein
MTVFSISVLVCTYNRSGLPRETLAALLGAPSQRKDAE